MKKFFCMLLAAALLLTALAGCQGSETGDGSAAGGEEGTAKKDTLIVIGESEVVSLNPLTDRASLDRYVKSALFDHLLRFGDDAQLVPCLAESWTLLDDNLTYEFKLRENVKFHDGSAFTADDVVNSFDIIMSDSSMVSTYGSYVAGYEKVDDHTVHIARPAVYTDLLGFLAVYVPIISKAAYQADPAGFASHPIGTGSYKFVSQEVDGSIVMTANEDYFFGAPEIPNLIIKAPLNSDTAAVALENGEVDLIFNVPSSLLPTLQTNENVVTMTEQTYSSAVLNIYKAAGTDVNLRKAIFHGIDRQSLIMIATDGLSQESRNILSTKAMGKYDGAVEYIGYDVDLAKEYLAKSSYVSGTELVISCTSDYALAAQSIQSDLAKIGITIKINQLDMNTYQSMMVKGEHQMSISRYGTYGFDAIKILQYLLPSNVSFGKNMDSSPVFETIMAELQSTTDPAEIDALVVQALQARDDLATMFSLYDLSSTLAYRKEITGISNSAAIVNGACYFDQIKLAA